MMELDYLVPVEQRPVQYINCGKTKDTTDLYSPTEHIYEELKDPPLPLPERNHAPYLNKSPSFNSPSYIDGRGGYGSEGKKRINVTYERADDIQPPMYPCCRRRKCFIVVFIVFLVSGVTTAGLLFHFFPDESTGKLINSTCTDI